MILDTYLCFLSDVCSSLKNPGLWINSHITTTQGWPSLDSPPGDRHVTQRSPEMCWWEVCWVADDLQDLSVAPKHIDIIRGPQICAQVTETMSRNLFLPYDPSRQSWNVVMKCLEFETLVHRRPPKSPFAKLFLHHSGQLLFVQHQWSDVLAHFSLSTVRRGWSQLRSLSTSLHALQPGLTSEGK